MKFKQLLLASLLLFSNVKADSGGECVFSGLLAVSCVPVLLLCATVVCLHQAERTPCLKEKEEDPGESSVLIYTVNQPRIKAKDYLTKLVSCCCVAATVASFLAVINACPDSEVSFKKLFDNE